MTQIEQIKAEIERLMDLFPKSHGEVLPIDQNAYNLISDLKKFINSLPAEEASEDLDEEIEGKINEYWNEWFSHGDYFEGTLPKNVFVAYCHKIANWQKEQMMKPAVDATCVLLPPPDVFKVLICHEVTDKLTVGQKVKVIFMEDEQCSTE